MYEAMVGGKDIHAAKSTPWQALHNKVRCLWPSRETALHMDLLSLIANARPIPRSYWQQSIPSTAKRTIFFDAPPNPPSKGSLETLPVSHAKCMYFAGNHVSVVYVGSHNFSKAAWGLRGEQPKNVELGVVLATTSPALRKEWRSRLPCTLPAASSVSPANYIPASAHSGARQALEKGNVNEAMKMMREWLTREETANEVNGGSNNENVASDTNVIKAEVIDLCDSD